MKKKTVRYSGEKPVGVVVGQSTYLTPVDHPDTLNVSNNKLVRTSRVVAFDEATGRVETLNTIYIPLEN